jgi:hypothetical protein
VRLTILSAVLLAIAAPPIAAQDRSPASLLGGFLIAFAVMEQCDIRLGPERDRIMVRAAEDLQAAAGVPDHELRQLVSEAAHNARGADCDIARANMAATVDDLLKQAAAAGLPRR